MNDCCKKYIETMKKGFEDGSGKVSVGLNRCPFCKEWLSVEIDSHNLNPEHNPLEFMKTEELCELLPNHLLIARNSKADLDDRYRIYNMAQEKYIQSTGAESVKGCLVKLLTQIAEDIADEM